MCVCDICVYTHTHIWYSTDNPQNNLPYKFWDVYIKKNTINES